MVDIILKSEYSIFRTQIISQGANTLKIKLIPSFIIVFIVGMTLVTAVEIMGIRMVVNDTVQEAHEMIITSQKNLIQKELKLHTTSLKNNLIHLTNLDSFQKSIVSQNKVSINQYLQSNLIESSIGSATTSFVYLNDQFSVFAGPDSVNASTKLINFYDQLKLTTEPREVFMQLDGQLYLVLAEVLQQEASPVTNGFIVCTYAINLADFKIPLLWNDQAGTNVIHSTPKTLNIPIEIRNNHDEIVYSQTFTYSTHSFDGLAWKLYNHSARILLFISVICILFIATLSHRVHVIISKIVSGVQRVAHGDYQYIVSPSFSYELNELSLNINALGKTVDQKIKTTHENHLEMLNVLVNTLEAKDEYTKGHSERVAKISEVIAQDFGEVNKDTLQEAALLHDIGKICIPEEILNKKGPLNSFEYNIIKNHASKGEEILQASRMLTNVSQIVRQHHEHFNGYGYPDNLSGSKILLEARIISVADAYDAMTSERPYRKSLSFHDAMDVLIMESDRQFDPQVIEAFMNHKKEIHSLLCHDKIQVLNTATEHLECSKLS